MEPQNDREFIIEMNGEIKTLTSEINGNIKNLTSEIRHLAEAIEVLEENRITPVEKRLTLVEKWQNNFDGGWKVAGVILALLTIVSLILGIKAQWSH